MQASHGSESGHLKREDTLSRDGKWCSFPKVLHLLQYVSNGNYYGQIKIGGKIIRESLKTTVWTTAKLSLVDFLKEHQDHSNHIDPPLFCDAVIPYETEMERNTSLKKVSKEYRQRCLAKIQKT